jgi:hypothetical protein
MKTYSSKQPLTIEEEVKHLREVFELTKHIMSKEERYDKRIEVLRKEMQLINISDSGLNQTLS